MKKKILIVLVMLAVIAFTVSAQARGVGLEVPPGSKSTVGKQWAVFIAIDEYKEMSLDDQIRLPCKRCQRHKKYSA